MVRFGISTLQNALFFHFFAKKFGKGQMINVSLHSLSKSSPSTAVRLCGWVGEKFWQNFMAEGVGWEYGARSEAVSWS